MERAHAQPCAGLPGVEGGLRLNDDRRAVVPRLLQGPARMPGEASAHGCSVREAEHDQRPAHRSGRRHMRATKATETSSQPLTQSPNSICTNLNKYTN